MQIFDIADMFNEVADESELGKSYCWILANTDEAQYIKSYLKIDEDSINECIDNDHPSKISFFDGYLFIIFNVLKYDIDTVKSKELKILLSKNYIVTIFEGDLEIIRSFIEDIRNSKNCFILKEKPQPSVLLYYLLDRIIVRNYDVISFLEAETDKIEINILRNPRHEQIDELIHLRRQVYKIRKYLSPLRYIGDSIISNDNSILEKECMGYFINLNNKIDKLMLALESLVQDLGLVREAFESEIANKTNELMKVFTLIATIFLPLNLITSMYGMNVKHIPFVHFNYGYYYVVFIMVIISSFMVYLFKKKRWL